MHRKAFTTIPSLADLNGMSGWNLRAFTDLLRELLGGLLCWLEPLVCFLWFHVLIVVDGGEGVYCFFSVLPKLMISSTQNYSSLLRTELPPSSREGFFGPKPLTIPQIRSGKLVPQILIGSLGHSPLSYYHGRKFFLRNNMQKTYPSKTFPPQNDYELKKATNRLEKIGGSCLDCANLILFGFPSARGLMGCFRKSRGRSTVVGQVDWAQHPKQGTKKKMTIQTHLSFSDTQMNWPILSVHKVRMFPTTSRKGWMLCFSNRMDEKRECNLM